MAKGRSFTKEFKEDAVRYRKEHPELTLQQAASNLGISMSAVRDTIRYGRFAIIVNRGFIVFIK